MILTAGITSVLTNTVSRSSPHPPLAHTHWQNAAPLILQSGPIPNFRNTRNINVWNSTNCFILIHKGCCSTLFLEKTVIASVINKITYFLRTRYFIIMLTTTELYFTPVKPTYITMTYCLKIHFSIIKLCTSLEWSTSRNGLHLYYASFKFSVTWVGGQKSDHRRLVAPQVDVDRSEVGRSRRP